MPEEIKEYRRPRERRSKKRPKNMKIPKLLLRQTLSALVIFSILFGLKALDSHNESQICTYIRNILTKPVQIHPIFKSIIYAPKNIFTKEGNQIETYDSTTPQTD